jgi:hypothetical protein
MCPLGSCKVSLLCSALILVAGCTAHFKITRVGHTIVESEPSEGAIHPYPWGHQPPPAQKDGLCVRVGGAQMWGVAMFSNLAPAPLALAGESLTVIDDF